MSALTHSILVVATADDVEYIGTNVAFEQARFPHFHCGGLDVGILGQIFWELSEDKIEFVNSCSVAQAMYSASGYAETVVVHAVPPQIAERYARLGEDDLTKLAVLWSQPNGRIRMPRASDFYEQLLREVAHLARIAVRDGMRLLLRTQFRRTA